MTQRIVLALLIAAAVGCSEKKRDSAGATTQSASVPAPAPAPRLAVEPTTPTIAAERPALPAVAAPTGAHKFVASKLMGLEMEVPDCAEAQGLDDAVATWVPRDPKCPMPTPGVMLTLLPPEMPLVTVDMFVTQLTASEPRPEILKKEATQDGWVVQWKRPGVSGGEESRGLNARVTIGGKSYLCIADGVSAADWDNAVRACASVRKAPL